MNKQSKLEDMFSILGNAMKPMTQLIEISAIWYNGKRYAKDDKVNYDPTDAEIIVKDPNDNTHIVIKCRGTIDSSVLEMELENLKTKEHITIKI